MKYRTIAADRHGGKGVGVRPIAARGEMYHALTFEDMNADAGREFLVFEISESLGAEIRRLSPQARMRLQNDVLRFIESEGDEVPDDRG